MANIKQMIGGTFEDIGEAVVQPMKDGVGQALEQGAQTTTNTSPITPQQKQKTQTEVQGRLVEARRKIDWWKKLAQEQQKVRDQQKQEELQRLQNQQNTTQQAQQNVQFEQSKKQQQLHPSISQKQTAAENKNKVGE